jgi:uncharacterized protein (TIGR02996 family)
MRVERDGVQWEIVRDGARLVITENGVEKIRKFLTDAHAVVQFDKLLAERFADGWREATGPAPKKSKLTDPIEPALEAAVLANREDRDARAVYGDWYQQQNHPRGQLVALQLSEVERHGDTTRAELIHRHLTRYKTELLGKLADYVLPDGDSPFEWFGGFIDELVIGADDDLAPQQVLRDVLAHPSGRLLAKVTLLTDDPKHVAGTLAALGKHPLLELRIVVTHDLDDELKRLASLATLRRFALAVIPDETREDEVGITAATFADLAALPPSVEAFELRIDDAVSGGAALGPLFERTNLQLRRFGLRAASVLESSCERLLAAPWAATLERFDAGMIRADRWWELLLAHRDKFPALRTVAVTTTKVRPGHLAALRAWVKVVDVTSDRDRKLFDATVSRDRYEDVQE